VESASSLKMIPSFNLSAVYSLFLTFQRDLVSDPPQRALPSIGKFPHAFQPRHIPSDALLFFPFQSAASMPVFYTLHEKVGLRGFPFFFPPRVMSFFFPFPEASPRLHSDFVLRLLWCLPPIFGGFYFSSPPQTRAPTEREAEFGSSNLIPRPIR